MSRDRLVSRLRQPTESFFNRLIDKIDRQRAGTVRSTEGLMIHCWRKLTFAFFLFVFNPRFSFNNDGAGSGKTLNVSW